MIDLSKLNLQVSAPESPDFGTDEIGRIAAFCYEHRKEAALDKYIVDTTRRSNREIGGARKKTQAAWGKMLDKLRADPNMISILHDAGLLDALNQATRLVAEGYEPIPDSGGKAAQPHLVLAAWAADEFFPDWSRNPAATINEALMRAGIIKSDKTQSVRVTLQNKKASEKQTDWQALLRKM